MFSIKRYFKSWLHLLPISQILPVPKLFLGYPAPLETALTLSGGVNFILELRSLLLTIIPPIPPTHSTPAVINRPGPLGTVIN